jgi:6-phosphogluconolactonase
VTRPEIFADPRAATQAAVEVMVEAAGRAIDVADRFLVALSGGSTPRALYGQLAVPGFADRIDWEAVHVFWGDERCVPPNEPSSNYATAKETLLDHVDVKPGHVHRIRGEDDPETAAGDYERLLRRAFSTPEGPPGSGSGSRFDLILLGMGEDGHTASLFPGTAAVGEAQRWVVPVEASIAPRRRVSLTLPLINASAEKVFVVTGESKSPALAAVLQGPHQPDVLPAQGVEGARWLVDEAAASRLDR